ncbi:uncharacterized protein G6M90_00g090890 [Metarhizium brunneum]|uniref:Uncharacterized protein n=1 Tax=Metarhizium brunneum TaxID=500148 RepID=A0A7D5V1N0_9HYPO|nr:hypothetical protein G6M90_00g090890 [Metarhizium brunneum]
MKDGCIYLIEYYRWQCRDELGQLQKQQTLEEEPRCRVGALRSFWSTYGYYE